MSVFDDFDELAFVALEPAGGKSTRRADVKLAFMKMRSAERLTLTFKPELLAEIGGPRFDVAWNLAKRLLLVKAGTAARFEAHPTIRAVSSRIVVPVPAGLHCSQVACEPEFYVDAIGKRLLIEVPAEFGRRLALPAPAPAAVSAARPAATPQADDEVTAGNRRVLAALGITATFPREIGGQRFTPSEAAIIEALYRRASVSRAGLLAATHDPEAGDDEREDKLVDVLISKMRQKLRDAGIAVSNAGEGQFRMDSAGKGVVREALVQLGAQT